MIRPPAVFYLSVKEHGARKLRIWVPVFVFWPLMLAIMVLFAPIVFLCSLVAAIRRRRLSVLFFVLWLYKTICSARGLSMHVENKDNTIRMYLV